MTVADVDELLKEVRRCAGFDSEYAHIREDDLLVSVLKAIADGSIECSAADLAAAALKSREIVFQRWYA